MRLIDAEHLIEMLKISKYLGIDPVTKIQNFEIERCISFVETEPTVDKGYQEGHIDGVLQGEKLYAGKCLDWIPITTRPLTAEERESLLQYYGDDYEFTETDDAFDCPMPEEGQEILISTSWGVSKDRCECDYTGDGMDLYALEDNGDWDGVKAWMPLPEPYKKEGEE